jgi:ferritin-like metal-binding protein YciE
MPSDTLQEQLVKYLTDAHSIEEQALQQMRAAPDIAGDERLAQAFRDHLAETEEQEHLIGARLKGLGAAPSKLKDVVMKAGGTAFVLFARSQPDTPGKLTAHAYSYEHLEVGAYELLTRVAERAGDAETAQVARRICDQERRMAARLESLFDVAVEASLRELSPEDLEGQLVKYLADAHAIEQQAIQLLERGPKIVKDAEIARIFSEHLAVTKEQRRLVEERLQAHGGSPSTLKDAAMRLGGLNWGAFFQAQPDTPGKLTAFTFAFEHLEIAGYELLKRVARRAGDSSTVDMAERITEQERGAAGNLAGAFDRAVEVSLGLQGVPA